MNNFVVCLGWIVAVYLSIGLLFFTYIDFTIRPEDSAIWEKIPWIQKFTYVLLFWSYVLVTNKKEDISNNEQK